MLTCFLWGDRCEADTAVGRQAGIPTALVLTGVTRVEDLAGAVVQPDQYCGASLSW